EVRPAPVGMPSIRLPQVETGPLAQRFGPGEPGRRHGCPQLGGERRIALRQPSLHAGEAVAGPVVLVAVLVPPGHEQERAGAVAADLVLQSTREGIGLPLPLFASEREKLALLLENHQDRKSTRLNSSHVSISY